MRIQVEELNGKSAFDYCRQILPQCQDAGESLEVYRGDSLAYTVSSIQWGSTRKIVENAKEGPVERKHTPPSEKSKTYFERKK